MIFLIMQFFMAVHHFEFLETYLDFTLEKNIKDFDFNNYLLNVKEDLKSFDLNFEINFKEKKNNTSVKSCFITFNLKELFNITYLEYTYERII